MKYLALLAFSCFLSFGFGQNILVSESMDIRTDLTYELLGQYGDNYLVASYSDFKFSIHNFNNELFLTSNQEFELEDKKSRIIHIYPDKEHFNILYSTVDKDFSYVINMPYNKSLERGVPDTIIRMEKQFQNYKYRYTFSEDKTKMGVLIIQSGDLIGYFVYDIIYKELVYSDEIQLEGYKFYEEYRKSVLSNSGILYLVFEFDNYYFKREKHQFKIIKIRDVGDRTEATIPMANLLTYDAYFSYDNVNNMFIISGLGSEKNLDRAELLFQIKQDPKNLNEYEFLTFTFQDKLLSDFYNNVQKNKRNYLENVQVQDLIFMDDGAAILVLEEVKKMERISSGSRIDYYGNRYTVDYHYENIMLFYLSADGDKVWQKLLAKRQFSNDDEGAYSSYFVFKNPNHLRFIYNDEIRNENTVSEYIIRPDGASLRTNLLSTDFQKLRLQVRNGMQISSHQVLIPSLRGKILKLLLIDYLN
ncbi:hypothetical protein [Membranihabitans marinus]|uniref:hypothetical protein n=1 Tax=Membranihabitans marinus TaxID=1227546 RepID=UPI001F3EF85D|nr:hypothetical protein [Membranihabitans marinus]